MSATRHEIKVDVSDAVRAFAWGLRQLADVMNGLFQRYPWESNFKVKTGRGGRRKRRARRSR